MSEMILITTQDLDKALAFQRQKLLDQAALGMPVPEMPPAATGPSLADCDAKLARYRAALDAGADPAVVTAWIAETQNDVPNTVKTRWITAREC